MSILVLNHVNKGSLLLLVQTCHLGLKFGELGLLILQVFEASLGHVVKHADSVLELRGGRITILEQLWVQIFFVVELSDLRLGIHLNCLH